MLLLLGQRMMSVKLNHLNQALIASVIRLFAGFLLGVLAVWLFSLTGFARAAVIIGSAMPAAVFNFVLAEKYDLYPELMASTVVISTLMAVVTTPLMLYFVQAF